MAAQSLILRDIGYRIGRHLLLAEANLCFAPGEITAVIGPSGSGKSTLIKCAATVYSPTCGEVFYGDQPLAPIRGTFRQKLGYVPQDDVIHAELKVEDAFRFAARLRLRATVSEEELRVRIDVLLQQLGLADRRHHRIRRLSGGQRKRVNVGIELLADPEVLILDEPASGLDPATESDLVQLLRSLADGRTVLLTTHSMEQLDQADQVVVLVQGRVVFAGPFPGLLAHFDVPHPADVFKRIRERHTPQTRHV